MNYNIRPVRLGDLDDVMYIERTSFADVWEYTIYLRICMQKGRITTDDGQLLMDILEIDGKLSGYAVWETDTVSTRGHILNLAIIEDERRKGYGRLLMKHVQDKLIESGMSSCFLEVRESNTGARRLYESLGYVESGRLDGYYFDEDAIEYVYDL
ncbi:MAG: GNAT family N-acetyltransferase [Candidatus Thorarchaeota archaeon]